MPSENAQRAAAKLLCLIASHGHLGKYPDGKPCLVITNLGRAVNILAASLEAVMKQGGQS
jgi:hypothetical protein